MGKPETHARFIPSGKWEPIVRGRVPALLGVTLAWIPLAFLAESLRSTLQLFDLPRGLLFHASVLLLLLAIGVLASTPSGHLRVGRDGFALREKGKERFVSFAHVENVELGREGRRKSIRITLTGGETISFVLPGFGDGRIDEVARDLEAALADARSRSPRRVPAGLADGAAATAEGPFRGGESDPDALLRVAADPVAPLATRAAAAAALRGRVGADHRSRLRVASRETASPRMRVILEAVADDAPDETLERALGELEADAPPGRARSR